MTALYKTNRLVLCMTDIRTHIDFINQSILDGKLHKSMVVATNNQITTLHISI